MKLLQIIKQPDTRAGRTFDLIVISLIIYSIITLSIETLPNLSGQTRSFLAYSEIVITLIFTFEYFLRILAAKNKVKYIFSFYGIIDLIAIIPFYLSLGVDLRGARAFRLFRIFRILKLARYSKAMNRLGEAFLDTKEETTLFFVTTLILLYLASVGIYFFEHQAQPQHFQSILHSLWWSVATLTTVGYGDVYPITVGGKLFTFVILMIGLGVIAVPAGLVASSLSKARQNSKNKES